MPLSFKLSLSMIEGEFLIEGTEAEEVTISSKSSLIRAGLVLKDIRTPKTHSNFPMDRQPPDSDWTGFS